MLRLFDHLASGNGYKVRLLLRMLDIPFERVEVDIVRGESRTPEFVRPVLQKMRAAGKGDARASTASA